jgi:uncharacterized repeat protein (TIGR03943 family)
VTTRDSYVTILAVGLLALWMGATNAMLKYLKPSMRPWVLLAAVTLIALGVYGLVRGRGEGRDEHGGHEHRLRIAWLLTLPVIVIILFGTEALGVYAAQQASASLPPYSFNLAAFAQSEGGGVPDLQTSDVVNGMKSAANRQYLYSHDVRLVGFVTAVGKYGSGTFVLTHYLIACCAADAYPLELGMVGAGDVPPEGKWVQVVARVERRLHEPPSDFVAAMMTVKSLKRIKAPSSPYEGLR